MLIFLARGALGFAPIFPGLRLTKQRFTTIITTNNNRFPHRKKKKRGNDTEADCISNWMDDMQSGPRKEGDRKERTKKAFKRERAIYVLFLSLSLSLRALQCDAHTHTRAAAESQFCVHLGRQAVTG